MFSTYHIKKFLRFLLFLTIGSAILYFVYVKQNQAYKEECLIKGIADADCNLLKKVYDDFVHSDLLYLGLVLFLFFLSNISRALRWQMMLKPIGIEAKFKTAFHSIMLGYFANLGLPRVGEFVRAGVLANKENAKFDKVMGTVVLDRIIDMFSLLLVFILTIFVSSGKIIDFIDKNGKLSDKILGIISNPIVWIVIVVFMILLLLFFRTKRFKNSAIGKKGLNFLKGLTEGLKSIKSIRNPFSFIFHSVFIWAMYFLMNFFGFKTFEPTSSLNLDAAITVFTFGSLGIVIPSPGGMGTYHFLVIEALKLYGVHGSDGFSYANIIFFSIQIIGIVIFGMIALFALNINTKKIANELQKQNI